MLGKIALKLILYTAIIYNSSTASIDLHKYFNFSGSQIWMGSSVLLEKNVKSFCRKLQMAGLNAAQKKSSTLPPSTESASG